jgi:hypothetical protein
MRGRGVDGRRSLVANTGTATCTSVLSAMVVTLVPNGGEPD